MGDRKRQSRRLAEEDNWGSDAQRDNAIGVSSSNGSKRPRINRQSDTDEQAGEHSDVNPYEYKLLDPSSTQIRLATLQPGLFNDPVSIHIRTILLNPPDPPKYKALSYAWGSPNDKVDLRVQCSSGKEAFIQVTRNLAEALPYLRDTDRSQEWWIDAICICQSNDEEKSNQVQRMGEIFRHASRVVAWLGPDSEDSSLAMQCLKAATEHTMLSECGQFLGPAAGTPPENAHWSAITAPTTWSRHELLAVQRLLRRAWYSRLWVGQEILLGSQDSILLCGQTSISRSTYQKALISMASKPLRRKSEVVSAVDVEEDRKFVMQVRQLSYWFQAWERSKRHDPAHLTMFLQELRQLRCSDPRDRVYAVVNLIHKPERLPAMIADYTQPADKLFRALFLQHALQSQSLGWLQYSGRPAAGFEETGQGCKAREMPCWVPDLSQPVPWNIDFWCFADAQIQVDIFDPSGSQPGLQGKAASSSTGPTPRDVGEGPGSAEFDLAVAVVGDCLRVPAVQVGTVRSITEVGFEMSKGPCEDIRGQIHAAGAAASAASPELCARYDNLNHFRSVISALSRGRLLGDPPTDDHRYWAIAHPLPTIDLAADILAMCHGLESRGVSCPHSAGGSEYEQLRALRDVCVYRGRASSLFYTENNRFGLGPNTMQTGDEIWIVLGCNVPLVLRPIKATQRLAYKVIGPAHVSGLMHGQMFLGPLPDGVELFINNDSVNVFRDRQTGREYDADPRLRPLFERMGREWVADFDAKARKKPWKMSDLTMPMLKMAGVPIEKIELV
jgi:hypothetical protein